METSTGSLAPERTVIADGEPGLCSLTLANNASRGSLAEPCATGIMRVSDRSDHALICFSKASAAPVTHMIRITIPQVTPAVKCIQNRTFLTWVPFFPNWADLRACAQRHTGI